MLLEDTFFNMHHKIMKFQLLMQFCQLFSNLVDLVFIYCVLVLETGFRT